MGLFIFSDRLHRVLADVELDLQTDDDYWPFFRAWDAACPEVGVAGRGDGMGCADDGLPGLRQVAQSLYSSQLLSVQRLREALSLPLEALRKQL